MPQVSGYCGLLLGSPVILYEIIAFVLPGLTRDERRFLGPIVLGSSVLFYAGIIFSYLVLTPAALNFFVNYAEGVVESLWSIDQYFEFVLVLMFSTGLSFQVPILPSIYILLGVCLKSRNLFLLFYCSFALFSTLILLVNFHKNSLELGCPWTGSWTYSIFNFFGLTTRLIQNLTLAKHKHAHEHPLLEVNVVF